MDIDSLIRQFQEKNVNAFNQLYDKYNRSLHGVIFNILRNEEMAEEVMNDVFIKIWNNADKYNPKKGRFYTWILNIARNAALDKTRSKAFKDQRKNLDADLFVNIIEVHDHVEDRMDLSNILNALKSMAEKCKQVIDAIFLKGYTQVEASEKLDIPLGTVKTRSRTCLKELRDTLNS